MLISPSLSCCTWRFVGCSTESTQTRYLRVWNFPSNNPFREHANRVKGDRATERGLVRDWVHLSPSSLPFVSCVSCVHWFIAVMARAGASGFLHLFQGLISCSIRRQLWGSFLARLSWCPCVQNPFCTGAPVTGSLPGRWLFFSGGLGPSLLLLQWTASTLLDCLSQFERIQPWTGLPCLCRAQIRTLKWTRWM